MERLNYAQVQLYLTTALTYWELAFSCAFGDEPIDVTRRRREKMNSVLMEISLTLVGVELSSHAE